MSRRSRCAIVLCFGVLACSVRAAAQNDPSWTERFEPFRIADNLYFVGTLRMEDKVARLKGGDANAFIDSQGYQALVSSNEQAYLTQLKKEQGK